jgi:hypothetical protein
MPHDDHRAPPRLASLGATQSTHDDSRRRAAPVRRPDPAPLPVESSRSYQDYDYDDEDTGEEYGDSYEYEEAYSRRETLRHEPSNRQETNGSSQDQYGTPVESRSPTPAQPIDTTPSREPPTNDPPPVSRDLTYQERQQLLMQAIQLFHEDWKLASIRPKPDRDLLIAYLTPRRSQMDLRMAISKQQVLVITVDHRGKTDIREPKRRGLWGTLISWLYGG